MRNLSEKPMRNSFAVFGRSMPGDAGTCGRAVPTGSFTDPASGKAALSDAGSGLGTCEICALCGLQLDKLDQIAACVVQDGHSNRTGVHRLLREANS